MPRRKQPRRTLLISLLLTLPLLGGCGLGWLYMRVADSQRIKAIKLLTYGTAKDRFTEAQKYFKKAVENYRESILYDEDSNPGVFHKLGYTLLTGDNADPQLAETEFRYGLKIKKAAMGKNPPPEVSGGNAPASSGGEAKKDGGTWAEKKDVGSGENKQSLDEGGPKKDAPKASGPSNEAFSEEEVFLDSSIEMADRLTDKSKDEDYSLLNSGMGTCQFIKAKSSKKEEEFRLALKYLRLADKYSRHPNYHRQRAAGLIQKIMASLNLDEVTGPTPAAVMLARVYNYQAERWLDVGQEKLADNALGSALDALESVKLFYETEPRHQLEMANYHFLRKEYSKCLSFLQEIKGPVVFDDLKLANSLRAKSLILTAKYDDAMSCISDLLERDPNDAAALILRATVNATKKDVKAEADVNTDIDQIFAVEANQKNPVLYMQAGDVYMTMTQVDGAFAKAKRFYMKAFYIEPSNLKANYLLGKCYQALNDTGNMKDCFGRVCKIDPTSSYCHDVDPLIR